MVRRMAVVVGVGAALLGVAACSSSKARPPLLQAQDHFAASVRSELAGLSLDNWDDNRLGGLGLMVCDDEKAGESKDQIDADLRSDGAPDWMIGSVFGAALVNFCPSYLAP